MSDLQLRGAAALYGAAEESQLATFHEGFLRRKGQQPTACKDPLRAFVSDNRWVADCPCGAGIACEPGWTARCFGCGRTFADVVFPAALQAIEDTLAVRVPKDRHWQLDEPVGKLVTENLAAKLPVPDGAVALAAAEEAEREP